MSLFSPQSLDRMASKPFGQLWVFAIRQAWAALFGGLMLGAIIFTKIVDLPLLSRSDWLFIFAIAIQIFMLVAKLEKPREAITILAFHLVGLLMEVFKTSSMIGSWSYGDLGIFHLGNVPLYSGFMYAAVGSYIARAWRVLDLDFTGYPKRFFTILFALAVYINFFSHHFTFDIRWILFFISLLLFGKTVVHYRLRQKQHRMPILIGFLLISFFIWLAENIATYFKAWRYPDQSDIWQLVSLQKVGAWYLLMIISFILIDLLYIWYNRNKSQMQSTDEKPPSQTKTAPT